MKKQKNCTDSRWYWPWISRLKSIFGLFVGTLTPKSPFRQCMRNIHLGSWQSICLNNSLTVDEMDLDFKANVYLQAISRGLTPKIAGILVNVAKCLLCRPDTRRTCVDKPYGCGSSVKMVTPLVFGENVPKSRVLRLSCTLNGHERFVRLSRRLKFIWAINYAVHFCVYWCGPISFEIGPVY